MKGDIMNKRLKKLIAATIGTVVLAGAVIPVLPWEPTETALKWASSGISKAQAASLEQVNSADEELIDQPAENVITNAEVVLTDDKGEAKRVVVGSVGKETAAAVVDTAVVNQLQQAVNSGKHLWLLDPVQVVKNNATKYGFNARKDTFTLISKISASSKSKAYVLVGHGSQYYLAELTQPSGKRVWQIVSIREVAVVTKPDKPVVRPGIEGLDYKKVIKWQQNVDEGRELWRLDPMQVAKKEGKQYYGLGDNAQFTIVRKLSSSAISRHGQIDLQVTQNGKNYTMTLVRPFGSDDGSIWTTYRVYEAVVQPGQPSSNVVFQTNAYKNWHWYKQQYPQDMGVAVVYSRQLQAKAQTVPQPVLDSLANVDLTDKVALLAYLGGTSSKHDIGIEKVTVKGNQMTVNVRAKSPRLTDPDTRDLTYPSDYVLVDRDLFNVSGGMNVKFVDQNGEVLGKTTVTIR